MKNLYLYIAVLLFGISNGFAQNPQNAIWHFGNHAGLDFNNANSTTLPSALTTLPTSLGFNPMEGCASVSDQNGDLLFFTDGTTVWQLWNGNYTIIADSLLGNTSSAQNAIIIPRPTYPNHYYVVTISGLTSGTGNNQGIHYSEIDLSNGLGQVVFLNVPLNDFEGNPINLQYGNSSEAITSTVHSDGSQYWLIAHVNSVANPNPHLSSYLVTENGIIPNPVYSEPTTVSSAFKVKVSPNTQSIALGSGGGAYLGVFDNTSGEISMNSGSVNGNGFTYSVEFSENSLNLYFAGGSIGGVSVANPINVSTISTTGDIWALQLGIDGKIYCSNSNSTQILTVISNPNNLTNPGYNSQGIQLGRTCNLGLPQWVHWNSEPRSECPNLISIASPFHDVIAPFQNNRQASNIIIAANKINSGASGIYHAGNTVLLRPGFHAESGSTFRAYIEGCTGYYVGKNSSEQEVKSKNNELTGVDKKISIYPNPSNSFTEISVVNTSINQISVASMDGKVVFNKRIESNTSYLLDTSSFSKGIYILSVESSNGKIYSEKLIKN